MKHFLRTTLVLIALLGMPLSAIAVTNNTKSSEWWNTPYPQTFPTERLKNVISPIHVKGNQFVDNNGKLLIFRGVNIADPDKLASTGKWKKSLLAEVKNWGANIVRIPVHPSAWQKRGNEGYFKLLDQAVIWANELNLYVIIDWHSIGNLDTELFQHPMYNTTLKETRDFWRQVAFRYQGVPTLAIYEIFNEPTLYNGQLGDISWDHWREINESIINIIYAHDTQVIPLVTGFNWAYDLREVKTKPIRASGIAYAAHPYPTKTKKPIDQKPLDWEATWGYVADTYPMIATEIGWMRADLPGAHEPVIDDGRYGPAIIGYLDSKGISWTAWCFDPDWPPQMISDWKYTPTEQGEFFRNVMRDKNKP